MSPFALVIGPGDCDCASESAESVSLLLLQLRQRGRAGNKNETRAGRKEGRSVAEGQWQGDEMDTHTHIVLLDHWNNGESKFKPIFDSMNTEGPTNYASTYVHTHNSSSVCTCALCPCMLCACSMDKAQGRR